eukprot:SAG22_NODE_1606_length_4012_cov_1.676463_3_plen_67_part_00
MAVTTPEPPHSPLLQITIKNYRKMNIRDKKMKITEMAIFLYRDYLPAHFAGVEFINESHCLGLPPV